MRMHCCRRKGYGENRVTVLSVFVAIDIKQMKYLDITDVQKSLPELLEEIGDSREEVTITRDGIAIAMILPFAKAKPGTNPYPLRGKPIWIADDFDESMEIVWWVENEWLF